MMTLKSEDSLQLQDIIDAKKKLESSEFFRQQTAYPPLVGRIMGMPVFAAPPEPPKIKLSESVTVSDEFRERMNAWLLERFGRRESVILSSRQVIYAKGLGFVMRPETMSVLRMNTTA
ncbi:MAG: hypothetical protein JAY60_19560 [Candidatus Thiodiazotropha weberae]|nr:hypothetical protein [Candidatus Thiodiazotropha weberae]